MKRSIVLHGQQVSYELTRKPVKYVNIRVRADGSVSVSAGEWVSEGQIGDFTGACIVSPACFGEIFSTGRPPPGAVELSDWGAAVFTGKTICLSAGARGEKYGLSKGNTDCLDGEGTGECRPAEKGYGGFLESPVSLGDVFPLRCHSAIYGAFGNSYAGNPSSFHDIPLGELYAGRPAGYLCPAVGGGAADLY